MAVEYLFLKIKQDIMSRAADLSAEATDLIQKGQNLAAEAKSANIKLAEVRLADASTELARLSKVDEILPSLLEQLRVAGIEQPPASFFNDLFNPPVELPESSIKPPLPDWPYLKPDPRLAESAMIKTASKPALANQNPALAALITSKTRRAILELLFSQPETPIHVREMARQTASEMNAVRRELENLLSADIIIEQRLGNRRYIHLNHDSSLYPIFNQLLLPITEKPESEAPIVNPPNDQTKKNTESNSSILEQELEDQFKNSPRYQEIIQKLNRPELQINQLSDLQIIRARLAGMVFEEIGYLHLLNRELDEDTIIFSPKETFWLYEKLFPDRKVINLDGFGLSLTIRGVTVPDGLIIKVTNGFLSIDTAIEYKSSSKDLSENTAFHDQLKKYTASALLTDLHRKNLEKGDFLKNSLRSLRPDLPDLPTSVKKDAAPLICVPSNSVSLINSKLGLDFEAIPFSTPCLTRLLDYIISEAHLSYKIPTISTK